MRTEVASPGRLSGCPALPPRRQHFPRPPSGPPLPTCCSSAPAPAASGHQRSPGPRSFRPSSAEVPGQRGSEERARRGRAARGRRDPQPSCPSRLPFPSDSAILSLIPPPFFSATPNPRPTSLFSPAPPMPPPGRRSPPRSLPGARGQVCRTLRQVPGSAGRRSGLCPAASDLTASRARDWLPVGARRENLKRSRGRVLCPSATSG